MPPDDPQHPSPATAPAPAPAERQFSALAHALFAAIPLGLCVAGYVILFFWEGAGYANQMGIAALATIFGMGTTVILGGAVLGTQGFSELGSYDLAWLVGVVGTLLAFVYTYSLELIERLPRIGPAMRKSREEAIRTVRERPWIRRWATVGVSVFVVSPLPGSGVLGGSIVGLLVGLTRVRTFVAVAAANVIVCYLYAVASEPIRGWTERLTLLEKVLGLAAALALFALLIRWARSLAAKPPPPAAEGGPPAAGERP